MNFVYCTARYLCTEGVSTGERSISSIKLLIMRKKWWSKRTKIWKKIQSPFGQLQLRRIGASAFAVRRPAHVAHPIERLPLVCLADRMLVIEWNAARARRCHTTGLQRSNWGMNASANLLPPTNESSQWSWFPLYVRLNILRYILYKCNVRLIDTDK